jgi:hypothetical protein
MGVPRDVPDERYFWYQYATLFQNTTKPVVVVCDTLADMEAITAMAAAIAGGMDRLANFLTFCSTLNQQRPYNTLPQQRKNCSFVPGTAFRSPTPQHL